MVLNPIDIHNKEFNTKMRGYSVDEVNDFLDQVIKDYQNTLDENAELKDSLTASNEKLKYFNDLKDSLNQSILVAQEAADKVKQNSQKEAEIIAREAQKQATDVVSDANERANQIIEDASTRAKRLVVETDDLQKSTRVFRQRLQVMLESQLDFVKGKDFDSLTDNQNGANTEKIKELINDAQVDKQSEHAVNSDASVEPVAQTPVTDMPQDDNAGETVVIFPDDQENHYGNADD